MKDTSLELLRAMLAFQMFLSGTGAMGMLSCCRSESVDRIPRTPAARWSQGKEQCPEISGTSGHEG